jgi:hypothetical protein
MVRELGSDEDSSDDNTGESIPPQRLSPHDEQRAQNLQQMSPPEESSASDPEITRPSSARSNYTAPEITIRGGGQSGPVTNSLSSILKRKAQNIYERHQLQFHLKRAIMDKETARAGIQEKHVTEKCFDPREYKAQDPDLDNEEQDDVAKNNAEMNKVCPYVEDPGASIKKKDKHITWGDDQVKLFNKDEVLFKKDEVSSEEDEASFQMDEELSDTDFSDIQLSDEIMADIYGETECEAFLERQKESEAMMLFLNAFPQSHIPQFTPTLPPIKKEDDSQHPDPMEIDSQDTESVLRFIPAIPSFMIPEEDDFEDTDPMQVDSQHTELFQDETLSDDAGAPLCRMPSNRVSKDTSGARMNLDLPSITTTDPSGTAIPMEADSQHMDSVDPKKEDGEITDQETLDTMGNKPGFDTGTPIPMDVTLSDDEGAPLCRMPTHGVSKDANEARPPPTPRPSFTAINKVTDSDKPSSTVTTLSDSDIKAINADRPFLTRRPPPTPRPSFKSINAFRPHFTSRPPLPPRTPFTATKVKDPSTMVMNVNDPFMTYQDESDSDCQVKQFYNPDLQQKIFQGRDLPLILVRLACSGGDTKGHVRFHPLYNWDQTAPPPKNLMSVIYRQEQLSQYHARARVMHDPVIKDKVVNQNERTEDVFCRIEKWAEETYGRKWLGYEGVRGGAACGELWGNWIVESCEPEAEDDLMVSEPPWNIHGTFAEPLCNNADI